MLKTIKNKLNSEMGKNVLWTFILQIAIMLCSFAINKLLASRLSIDDFGQYNVIKRSVQVISFVMLAGVGIALPRYIPIYRNSTPPKPIRPLLGASLLYIIGISLIVFHICMLFSEQMQLFIIGMNDNMVLLLIALAYAFILAIAQYIYAYYRGIGNFIWYNGTQLCVQFCIVLPLLFLPVLSVTNVFMSWLLITILLVLYYLCRELWTKRASLSYRAMPADSVKSSLFTIIKYSSGRLMADFFLFSLAAFPLIFISNTQGFQSTAHFSIGITFVTMVTPVFSIMGIILLPYVSECIAKKKIQQASHLVNRLTLLYICSAIIITIVLYAFTEFLTILLFAKSYTVTIGLTRIIILSILPQALYLLFRNPVDAISIVPYNTIILGISILSIVLGFIASDTLTHFAWVYFGISCLQCLLSWGIWEKLKRSNIKEACP